MKMWTAIWDVGSPWHILHHNFFFGGGGDLLGLKFMQSSDNKSAMLVDGIHLKNVSR